jgi:lysophospholipase L1-like esterase
MGIMDFRKTPDAALPARLQDAALNATYAGISTLAARPSNTIVLIGDSLTAYNGGLSTATPAQSLDAALLDGKGIHNWANFFLGKDLSVLGNSGIGGQTSTQILARFTTDALNLNPAMVSILAGTNDPVTMDTIGNLTAMYTAALAAGIRVVAQTVPPTTTSAAGIEARRLKINDWIRGYARSTPGVILSDMAATWQDPTLAGYKPVVAYVGDGTHPTVAGAMAAGRVFADAVRPFVPRNRTRAAAALAPFNMLGNPHFTGTVTNVNASTNTMGAWNISGTGLTFTPMDRTDGFAGRMLQIVVPAGGSVNLTTNVDVDGTALKIGDSIDFGVELEIAGMETTPANTKTLTATIQQYNGSSFGDRSYDLYSDTGALYGTGLAIPDGSYRLSTPPVAVATGRTLIQSVVSLNGGGTYRLKGSYLRNLTGIAAA